MKSMSEARQEGVPDWLPPADDIVEITRQRLADGRHIAEHDVARLVEMIDAYREVLRMVLEQISQRLVP